MRTHALIAAMLTCTACTSVDVNRVSALDPKSRVGLPYPLPFTQYKLQLTRQVIGCGPNIKLAASAKIEETRNAPDPLHRYVIDPNSLASIVKTSEIKAEYHPNGLVKSLNATAEDKTAEVIANVGSIGVKIASLAAGVGAAGDTLPEACSEEVVGALAKVAEQKPKLEAATKLVETRTAALKTSKDKIVTLGAAVNEKSKDDLSQAHDLLAEAVDAQKRETRVMAKLMEPLSQTEIVQWPGDGDTGRGVFHFDPAVIARWKNPKAVGDDDPAVQAAIQTEIAKLDIYAQVVPLVASGRSLQTESPLRPAPPQQDGKPVRNPGAAFRTVADTVVPKLGIPFRQPDHGWLRLCSSNHCDSGGEALADQRGSILQLGYVYYLPCESRPFSSISCSFELTEDGWLKSMGTAQKQAALVGATDSVESLLDSATSIRSTLKGAATAALEAETKALKAEADYRAAVKALDDDPNAATTAERAGLQANVELARARKALLEAEAELEDARKALASRGS